MIVPVLARDPSARDDSSNTYPSRLDNGGTSCPKMSEIDLFMKVPWATTTKSRTPSRSAKDRSSSRKPSQLGRRYCMPRGVFSGTSPFSPRHEKTTRSLDGKRSSAVCCARRSRLHPMAHVRDHGGKGERPQPRRQHPSVPLTGPLPELCQTRVGGILAPLHVFFRGFVTQRVRISQHVRK